MDFRKPVFFLTSRRSWEEDGLLLSEGKVEVDSSGGKTHFIGAGLVGERTGERRLDVGLDLYDLYKVDLVLVLVGFDTRGLILPFLQVADFFRFAFYIYEGIILERDHRR